MSRPRGFASWSPHKKTRALVDQVDEVLDEYRGYLPLTVRQVFYRLVGKLGYDKTEQSYARLCELMSRARRAGDVPFEYIRDDGVSRYRPTYWSDRRSFWSTVRTSALTYELDRQLGQPHRLWLLSEAGGMAPMLAGITYHYGLPVLSSGGFDSLTAKHELAKEIVAADAPAVVLHIADYDPSGVHLYSSLAEDVSAMVEAMDGPEPEFRRIAITPEQITKLDLPTAPPKKSDRRGFDDTRTVQAEAIPPDELERIVVEAIEDIQCPQTRSVVLEREKQDRIVLARQMEGLS